MPVLYNEREHSNSSAESSAVDGTGCRGCSDGCVEGVEPHGDTGGNAPLTTAGTTTLNFVNLPNMQFLTSGLAINVGRCADLLDALLIKLNEQMGIGDTPAATSHRA